VKARILLTPCRQNEISGAGIRFRPGKRLQKLAKNLDYFQASEERKWTSFMIPGFEEEREASSQLDAMPVEGRVNWHRFLRLIHK
jgi:hypothetical protein